MSDQNNAASVPEYMKNLQPAGLRPFLPAFDIDQSARQVRILHYAGASRSAEQSQMKFGALLMPSHPPERSIRDDQRWDLNDLEHVDMPDFEEAHFTVAWEPCPALEL